MSTILPDWLERIPVERILRIDLGLEGDWSASVRTVWRPADGYLGLGERPWRHPRYRAALELYLDDGWFGVRCDRRVGAAYDVDEDRARAVIQWLEERR